MSNPDLPGSARKMSGDPVLYLSQRITEQTMRLQALVMQAVGVERELRRIAARYKDAEPGPELTTLAENIAKAIDFKEKA